MAKKIIIGGTKPLVTAPGGDPIVINAAPLPPAPSDQLIYEETFEGAAYFPLTGIDINKTHALENCGTAWTLSRVTSPVYYGTNAARFEIRKDQPLVGGGERIRSEATIIKGSIDIRFTTNIWYSYAVYFPSEGSESDPSHDTVTQWYEDGGPDVTIKVRSGKAYLETLHPTTASLRKFDLFGAVNAASTTSTSTIVSSFTAIPRDQWHEFIFHFIHSPDSDGLIEIWRDGTKIQTITGRNMHSDPLIYPKMKLGVYKSDYTEDPSASLYDSRVIYFDNIRIGKNTATLGNMISAAP